MRQRFIPGASTWIASDSATSSYSGVFEDDGETGINEKLHAVIDFERSKAYCRGNFPPPGGAWHAEARDSWRDDLANLLD